MESDSIFEKSIYQLKFSFCYANLTDFLRGDSQQTL